MCIGVVFSQLQPISGGNEGRVENWDSEVPTPEMSQEDAMLPSQATQDFENNMGLDDFGYSGYAGYGGKCDPVIRILIALDVGNMQAMEVSMTWIYRA